METAWARGLGKVIARIVPGPARSIRPEHQKDEDDDKEAGNGVDRGTCTATDDHADDDPDDEDPDDPEDDVARGVGLADPAAEATHMRGFYRAFMRS